jgi:acetyl esterase/lipase
MEQDMPLKKQSFVYKTVGRCRIGADVYAPAPGTGLRPAVLHFHGGALVMGTRQWLDLNQARLLTEAGYVVVSCDYRLAPETPLAAIVEDIEDAYAWLRRIGPSQLGVDADRIAVMGHSAGGYLTLLAGARFRPRPKALVAFYGYGDIVGPWYTQPSPHYSLLPAVDEATARALLRAVPPCHSGEERVPLYLRLRQQGTWPRVVSGHDPESEPGFFAPYCPLTQVTADYPPALLLHGDADTDVPYEQSVLMSQALTRAGVEHELVTIAGGEHGFDSDASEPQVQQALRRVVGFLDAHLQ